MASHQDLVSRLRAALKDRYAVETEIGSGGMATVYLAEDLAHGRKVAIKVLSPDVAHALGAERFLKEIEVAAGLTHPNILPLFDSGEAHGLLYYVMPYVEEESLRDRLGRERQLPPEEVIRIVGEVADALSYAHDQGLVHRDIKPENILFAAGHAAVADFGIAKGLDAAGGEQLTRTGVTLGTPAYMSPEQAGGAEELDGRSDLYSLGCVAYEMLAGQPPFTATTPQAVMARHAVDPPPELQTVRPDIPAGVSRAVHKALAKVPTDRHSSTRDFAEALRQANTEEARAAEATRRRRKTQRQRGVWASAVVLAFILGVWVMDAITGPAYERLAVLPPTNLLNNPEQERLILGVHDALVGELQKAGVPVKARTSVMQYRAGTTPIREIAAELGVDALVEPAVHWAQDSVEIDLRLVDGETEEYIADPIVRAGAARNILGLYGELVQEVVGVLQLGLSTEAEARLTRAQPVDPDAYEDYLNGRFHWRSLSPAGLQTAQEYYGSALEKEPDFAQAQAGIAHVWAARQQMGFLPPSEAAPEARAALSRALAMDSAGFYVQFVAGAVRTWVEWDWEGGEASFQRALEINPEAAEVRAHYAHLLMMLSRWEECEEEMDRALELDPRNPIVLAFYGQTLNGRAMFPEAIAFFQNALRTAPDNPVAHSGLMTAYRGEGMHREALEHAAASLAVFTGENIAPSLQAAYRSEGHEVAWRMAAEAFVDVSKETYVLPRTIAVLFDWAGETDQAFEWLERAFEVRDPNLPYLNVLVLSDTLRADPRFRNLQRRMNLPVS